jgi:hypothetical protein
MRAAYRIMRCWLDGEAMQAHQIGNVEFSDFSGALDYSTIHGGYVERASDGAVWASGQWIVDGDAA